MLRGLGSVFYLFAIIAGFGAILSLISGGGMMLFYGFSGAISMAFFGAMSFAADEAIQLLRRIAGGPVVSGAPTGSDSTLR